MCGKNVFNIINTCAYLALILMVEYHGCGAWKKINCDSLVLIFVLLWWCIPAFGHSFLWVTGASNYLYGILFILIFLIPYRRRLETGTYKNCNICKKIILAIFMLPAGILAGATNENTS